MTMIRTLLVASVLAGGALAPALIATPALAQVDAVKAAVDAAKAAGKVGERWDGFVGAVTTVDASTQAAIEAMNARRKGIYVETAAKTGATPEQAGVVFAEKIILGLPAGYYYMPQGGSWMKK